MAARASNCCTEIARFTSDQRFQYWVLVDQFCGVAAAESGLGVGALRALSSWGLLCLHVCTDSV